MYHPLTHTTPEGLRKTCTLQSSSLQPSNLNYRFRLSIFCSLSWAGFTGERWHRNDGSNSVYVSFLSSSNPVEPPHLLQSFSYKVLLPMRFLLTAIPLFNSSYINFLFRFQGGTPIRSLRYTTKNKSIEKQYLSGVSGV